MGWMNWFKGFLSGKKLRGIYDCNYELEMDYFYKKLAVESCIDLIANAIMMCEFQTFDKGKEIRSENYYLLNVQPNQNQNSSEFIHSLVHHLIDDNECLVIMRNDQLYIADEFTVDHYTFSENVYKNVVIGDLSLMREYKESEVLYFKLNDTNIMQVIDGMYESLGKLLVSSINFYKRKNSKRFLLKGNFLRAQDEETQKKIDDLFDNQFKNWLDPNKETSTFQLPDGYGLEDLSDGGKGASNNSTSRDVSALINDIFSYVATAFHVPIGILKGDVADVEKQMDSFLAFCINPIAKLIQDEFNRKMYKKKEFLKRSYLKVDTTKIKVVDITKLATALDKLFAIGGLSVNDVLTMLGKEPINEEWANKRYVTKNYQEADSLEGGEE